MGIYDILDNNLDVRNIIARATLAAKQCKGQYMIHEARYTEELRAKIIREQNIINENHYEFVGEGHRYYDVVRWGITEVLNVDNVPGINSARTWKSHNKYVAIPQGDIDATKGTEFELKQNEGY